MANLILKPTSGGEVKLQNNAGTDAVSVSNAGVATIANATITAGTFPAGHVIGIWYKEFTSTQTTGGTAHVWQDITNLTQTITPKSVNSKFWITTRIMFGGPTGNHNYVALNCGGSVVHIADAAGSRFRATGVMGAAATWHLEETGSNYLWDANTTSAVIIKTQWASEGTSGNYVNRSSRDTDAIYDGRGSSDLTIMEISS
jgi:hypothetical protein